MRVLLRSSWYGVFLFLIGSVAQGQRVHTYEGTVGAYGSSAQTPFWLRANQYGVVPLNGPVLQLGARVQSTYRTGDSLHPRPKLDWGYAANVVVNAGKTNQILIPEAYVKARYGAFELYAGRRREIVGLVDTLLTTGAYAWSGNALPIPKIQLAIPIFTTVPFTKGIVSVMGAFAHGWFENSDRLITGSYLHQSYFYGRLGKPTWRFRLYGGINHEVIWAGRADPSVLGPIVSVDGRLPSGIKYYPAVIFGTQGLYDPNDPNVTSFEDNRIGNHLGSVDVAADVDIADWNVFVYRQSLYDDGSLFYLINIQDGLNGIRVKNRNHPTDNQSFFLRQITFEYLFTGNQGGDVFVIDDPYLRGTDDYFNHSQFLDGWKYFGRTIGTPFLTPTGETRPDLPTRTGIVNNRVSVFHLGVSALLFNKLNILTRLSFSRNAGTYPVTYLKVIPQFSGLLTASYPVDILGGTSVTASLALDSGQLLPNSVGAYVGLRKSGVLGGFGRTLRKRTPSTIFRNFPN